MSLFIGCFLRCLGMMLARAFQPLFVLETNGRPVKYLTPFHPSLRPRFQPSYKSVWEIPSKILSCNEIASPPPPSPTSSTLDHSIFPLSLSLFPFPQNIPRSRETREEKAWLFKGVEGKERSCLHSSSKMVSRRLHSSEQITSLVKSSLV